jgi:hypothetical protein
MHATVRRYASSEMADLLASRSEEVESLMSGVPGLHGYFLVRTDDGCMSITVCDDESGTDESTRRAATWLRENASGISGTSPDIASGDVIAHARAAARA